ncbi:Unknown protein [Striga hermonthica]|uniref:Uncharacterized protein n=1 Tax=Striga hermonthica TaxID=68872 RepID=A0A9N7N482_STRHE|nr:Unknown protein [Striga hermonthica]
MAQILTLTPTPPSYTIRAQRHRQTSVPPKLAVTASATQTWTSVLRSVKCNGRFTCLFSNNRKQEEALKALESALDGKKTEFEKWDKEIKKREEASGGGDSAQQAGLTILGIIFVFLVFAKGDMMLAVILNPLLVTLRVTRTGLTLLMSKVKSRLYGDTFRGPQQEVAEPVRVSAKERVVGKWGSS